MPEGQEILHRAAQRAGLLISVCSWCSMVTAIKLAEEPKGSRGLSHGGCIDCITAAYRKAS